MTKRGIITVQKPGKKPRNIAEAHLERFERVGYKKVVSAPAPIEAKKIKKAADHDVDSGK